MAKISLYITLFIINSFILANRGDLISTEILNTLNANNNQTYIDNELSQIVSDQFSIGPVEYGITLYKITYETIQINGSSHVATGTIAYPRVDYPQIPNQAFPTLSYQHGTVIEKSSVTSINGLWILPAIIAGSGYVYVEADYLGLGDSECRHPYQLKEPYGTAVVDFLRALKQFSFEINDFEINDQLFLAGYSEGGYATMSVHEIIERDYADEIQITASFPMAGAYSMSGLMVDVMLSYEPYDQPFYFPYVLFSYIDYYPDLGIPNEYLLSEYHHLYDLFDGFHSSDEINAAMPTVPITIMKPDSIASFASNPNHPLRLTLEENDNWNWYPEAPIYLFHGIADELVPVENSQMAYDQFLLNGSQDVFLELIPESWGGHADVAPFALLGAFEVAKDMQMINELGDSNQDGEINIIDLVNIVNYIINDFFIANYDLWVSDLNMDSSQDILDIIILGQNIIR